MEQQGAAGADGSTAGITSDDIVWEVYALEADLPSASSNHGMFAHVHGTGKAYYAHAGAWTALATKTELDNLSNDSISTDFVASGILPNGTPVVLNNDGTVTKVAIASHGLDLSQGQGGRVHDFRQQ